MAKRCEQCEKEFASDGALLQHYSSKHPSMEVPQHSMQGAKEEEEKRQRNSRKHEGRRRGRKSGSRNLILALGLVVLVVAAGVGAYALYGQQPSKTASTGVTTVGINTGDRAPDLSVSLINGTSTSLSRFQGHPVVVWFVTTWCPGCQQGAQIIASQYYSQLRSEGVTLLAVESYNDLGYSGPTMPQFAAQYAGGNGSSPGWLFATTTQSATYTYNPQAALDVYYLVSPSGTIVTSGQGLAADIQSVISTAGHLQSTSASSSLAGAIGPLRAQPHDVVASAALTAIAGLVGRGRMGTGSV